MKSLQLTIGGLEEKETQGKVKKQLKGILGVQSVYVSDDETFINVYYDDPATDREINRHLQNNGYKIM